MKKPKIYPLDLTDLMMAVNALATWRPPRGVRHEIAILPRRKRFALILILSCGDYHEQYQVSEPIDEHHLARLDAICGQMIEAAWDELVSAVNGPYPFDVDDIPRG